MCLQVFCLITKEKGDREMTLSYVLQIVTITITLGLGLSVSEPKAATWPKYNCGYHEL